MKKGITLIAALAAVLAVTSGAFAAKQYLITSSGQIKSGVISLSDLSSGARQALKGQEGPKGDTGAAGERGLKGDTGATGAQGLKGDTGAAGAQGLKGDTGATGAQGPKGDTGQALAAAVITPVNAFWSAQAHTDVRVVDVDNVDYDKGGPDASSTKLFDPVHLAAGQYKVDGVVQFFDFLSPAPGTTQYGVTKMYLDNNLVGTQWTPAIPSDGQNGAQASGSMLVNVPAGGDDLTVTAAIRRQGSNTDGGQAGANLIVTRIG